MKYNFCGKTLVIPDKEIDNYVDKLELTIDEAIELWLEDNGYQLNEEQDALDKAASGVKISAVTPVSEKIKKSRVRVASDEKQAIFNLFDTVLNDFCAENDASYEIVKKNKCFCVNLNGKSIKIDIVEHRTPKNAEN